MMGTHDPAIFVCCPNKGKRRKAEMLVSQEEATGWLDLGWHTIVVDASPRDDRNHGPGPPGQGRAPPRANGEAQTPTHQDTLGPTDRHAPQANGSTGGHPSQNLASEATGYGSGQLSPLSKEAPPTEAVGTPPSPSGYYVGGQRASWATLRRIQPVMQGPRSPTSAAIWQQSLSIDRLVNDIASTRRFWSDQPPTIMSERVTDSLLACLAHETLKNYFFWTVAGTGNSAPGPDGIPYAACCTSGASHLVKALRYMDEHGLTGTWHVNNLGTCAPALILDGHAEQQMETGRGIIVINAGSPCQELKPYESTSTTRTGESLRGRIDVRGLAVRLQRKSLLLHLLATYGRQAAGNHDHEFTEMALDIEQEA
jgi:hypothetical protein